ncbi:carbohydrate ABC transporter permease [Pedococcus sp. 5OH_020]|uniref:carbohydrate ABC transporter permease n=1 Tax=Pedococcus sp. 5OH_020 TaxID=2989814 RepID=UPI0022E9B1D0|nr:carbohydrate ABC transporter permease [Pedococcus sp. 5OH_020]
MRQVGRILTTLLILAVIVAAFLGPYVWMFASGLKTQASIFTDVVPISWRTFIPVHATIDNVTELFADRGIGRALLNSALVAVGQVLGALAVCCPAAYALTRIKFPGRNVIFAFILATFMLPSEALAVPLFQLVGTLGLQDTLVGVGIPWIANAFGLFLLRQAFEGVPHELDEAARLDGAGHLRIFWSVILPNIRADLVTFVLTIFLFSWNGFLWPLIAIQTPEKQLVQVAIAQSVSPGELPNWGLSFAGASIATIPLLVLFVFLQRLLIPGLARSGLK